MPDPLVQPVTFSMRSTDALAPEDSLERAAALLRDTAYPFIPIQEGERLVRAVSESSLAEAMAEGRSWSEPCVVAACDPPTIGLSSTGAEALRRLTTESLIALLVVDEHDRVLGVVSPSDLTPHRAKFPTPPTIGGMATPFGVYLTTGTIHGGAGAFALMSSGAMMFCMFLLADVLASWASTRFHGLDAYATPLTFMIFLVTMRLLPLAGTHAAEHMVVHAIERGEQLTPEVVRRMPRVHPRCGTNLAVGASIFVALLNLPYTDDPYTKSFLALIATALVYRPAGAVVQFLITTRPPNNKQIASGIKAGKELLERYRLKRGPVPNAGQRILNSGMLHVMAGSAGAYLVAWALATILKLPLPV